MLYLILAILLVNFSCAKEEVILDENIDAIENPDNSDPITDDTISSELKAFPTAEGAGAYTIGGRGGKVLHVTTLEDGDYEGTFRWAVEQNYPRTIVFDVSGVIQLKEALLVNGNKGYMTIAGQTAPEGGITIEHYGLGFYRMDQVIIRYVRFLYKGYFHPNGPKSFFALAIDGCTNTIVDHCSFRYTWKNVAINVQDDLVKQGNITLQRNLIGQCLTGVLMGSYSSPARENNAGKNSAIKNLFVHVSHRFPNVIGNARADIVNNVVYNWRYRLSAIYNKSTTNQINNYWKRGSVSNVWVGNLTKRVNFNYMNKIGGDVGINNGQKIYTEGNIIPGFLGKNDDNWLTYSEFFQNNRGEPIDVDPNIFRVKEPFPLNGPVNILDAELAYEEVVNDVGTNKTLTESGTTNFYLDYDDNRYIEDVKKDNCSNCTPDGYGYLDLTEVTFPTIPSKIRSENYDSDKDGMPNKWEIAMGFNPNVKDHNEDSDGDGYTNLEEFLNLVDKK